MLDDFMEEQPVAYKFLINSMIKNKLSHAYLVETNGYPNSLDFVKCMVKYFLCPQKKSKISNCDNCNQCLKIDKNEFIELKIIDAEGQWIKKSQLDELQDEFSKKSIVGNKKVYIIKNAEKLNASSANSLLKFLEEPEEGIIAILMVENRFFLLDTIVSRCQIISLNRVKVSKESSTLEKIASMLFDSKERIKQYLEDISSVTKIERVLYFVEYYEKNHLDSLIYINKLWHENFKEKDDISNALFIMAIIYNEVLNYMTVGEIEYFNDYDERIIKLCEGNTEEKILKKIKNILNIRDKIKYNINPNLAMDKLIIDLEDVIVDD